MDKEIKRLEHQIELGDDLARLELHNLMEKWGSKDRPSKIYWIYEEQEGRSKHTGAGFSSWSESEKEYISLGLQIDEPKNTHYWDSVNLLFTPKLGEELYCVVVIYSTGDTFGCYSGCGTLEGAYRSEANAKVVKQCIEDKSYEHLEENKYKYLEWTGHFQSLEEVQIHKFELKNYIHDLPEKIKIDRKTARQKAREKKNKKRKKRQNKSKIRTKNRGWEDDEYGLQKS